MIVVRIISWIARVSGVMALLLGLFFWLVEVNVFTTRVVFNPSFIAVHITFGVLVALALLVLSAILLTIKGGRLLGIAGFVYALIVPTFGELQLHVYVSGAAWLVPTVHLLIGIGAIVLSAVIVRRYDLLRQRLTASTENSAKILTTVR